MNQNLVGQWYKDEMGETLNIFNETPLRMKMSFNSSGFYNFEPNCIYEKDGYLCFEINDEHYRMVYHVKAEGDRLVGYYTQFGEITQITYRKISDTPADEPFKYMPAEEFVPALEESRLSVLKRHAVYDRGREYGCKSEFVLGGDVPEILEKYQYSTYVEGLCNTDDRLAFRLLDFVCDHFGHNGSGGLGTGRTITTLIEFCEQNSLQSNCRGLAILLASLLRLNGIKAQHITCMPYEEPFYDCHVVVDCLLPSGKRVMLDPTWRLYLKDRDSEYISLPHLRELLIADEPIYANESAGYNGGDFNREYHRNYMIKNTFRFARCTLSKEGVDGNSGDYRYIELIPQGYPTDQFVESAKTDFVCNDAEFWQI